MLQVVSPVMRQGFGMVAFTPFGGVLEEAGFKKKLWEKAELKLRSEEKCGLFEVGVSKRPPALTLVKAYRELQTLLILRNLVPCTV